jgi:tetratricopeptide (TPR) repeat protein
VDQNEAALKLRGKGTGTNDWAMARSAYLLAAKLLPKHPVLLLNLAIADFDLGLYSECAGAYETLAVIAPNKLEANDCARLGSSYAVLGEYSKAVSSFEKGLRASPGDENLHGWFAVASYGSGGWPAAKEAWRRNHPEPALRDRRVDREQFFDWVYGGLWDLAERAERKNIRYAALKHYSMAHAVLSEAVRDDLFYGYGDWPLKERRKIVSKVAEIYQQLPLKPVLPPAAERLALEGQNYISQREWAKARASYQMALDLAPWWPEGHYNLALLWGAEPGFEPGAIREMRIYLNLAPNGNRAQTATAKLRVWEQRMRDAISQGAQVRDDLPFLIKPDREP